MIGKRAWYKDPLDNASEGLTGTVVRYDGGVVEVKADGNPYPIRMTREWFDTQWVVDETATVVWSCENYDRVSIEILVRYERHENGAVEAIVEEHVEDDFSKELGRYLIETP
jgi:hypothetical protein